MANLNNIFQSIRTITVNNGDLQAIVGTRIVPQRVDLTKDTSEYPMVMFATLGGFPDQDNYPYDNFVIDVYYVSDKSVDEAIEIYNLFNTQINKQIIRDTANSAYFYIAEDSKPIDASGVFGRNILYIYSNTYRIKVVG